MTRYLCLIIIAVFLFNGICFGQERRVYETSCITGEAPVIDGKLDEPVWEQVNWGTDFIQSKPYERADPSAETAFKILYDNNNLYVAIRAFDTAPDSIVRRMARRDNIDGDYVEIQFDSYFDHRTAFIFAVNAAGVKIDYLLSQDGSKQDYTWDPIWYVKTNIDESGWIAEMQIPLSQLRFTRKEKHRWGLQVSRYFYRKVETSLWQFIPQEASGWVSRFGLLTGITDITPRRQFDIFPYVVTSAEIFEEQPENPYASGHTYNLNAGIDGKLGVTNDLTMDFTINPDFGQVEADPSVVNLTTFETYYDEKRPFFIEGRNILNYSLTTSENGAGNENLFYSRRIGRAPQYIPKTGEDEYIKMPGYTPILAAIKLTGKTRDGLSVGFMQATTAEQKASISHMGEETHPIVEPLTSYTVARLQKDYNMGNTIVGGMITSTFRNLTDSSLYFLHKNAVSGGVDFAHYWKGRSRFVAAKLFFSQVTGEPEALLRTQRSSVHYFQRPDAHHLTLDPDRTKLLGHGGGLEAGKIGGRLTFGASLNWRSPGLELNDIGFVINADEIAQKLHVGYRIWDPFSIFRNIDFNAQQFYTVDFSGKNIDKGISIRTRTQFINNWALSLGSNIQLERFSNYFLRGGPSMILPGVMSNNITLMTDRRKSLVLGTTVSHSKDFEGRDRTQRYSFSATYHPSKAIKISVDPSWSRSQNHLQYVTQISSSGEARYIHGLMNQETSSLSVRINYSITPDLSVQYYGQPFISSGKYSDYKYITNPAAKNYSGRFAPYADENILFDDTEKQYLIDEDNDGIYDYGFRKPDFNALFFNSNLVIRWEYLPGSTLFVVWTQSRNEFASNGYLSINDNFENLFNIYPYNVFLIKMSYRLGI